MTKFVPRVCARCGKTKGTMSFRWQLPQGTWTRGYFHPNCFKQFMADKK